MFLSFLGQVQSMYQQNERNWRCRIKNWDREYTKEVFIIFYIALIINDLIFYQDGKHQKSLFMKTIWRIHTEKYPVPKKNDYFKYFIITIYMYTRIPMRHIYIIFCMCFFLSFVYYFGCVSWTSFLRTLFASLTLHFARFTIPEKHLYNLILMNYF